VIRRLRPWAPFFVTAATTFTLGATGASLASQIVGGVAVLVAYVLGRKDEEQAYLAAMRQRVARRRQAAPDGPGREEWP
jgi:hypothetical protein